MVLSDSFRYEEVVMEATRADVWNALLELQRAEETLGYDHEDTVRLRDHAVKMIQSRYRIEEGDIFCRCDVNGRFDCA